MRNNGKGPTGQGGANSNAKIERKTQDQSSRKNAEKQGVTERPIPKGPVPPAPEPWPEPVELAEVLEELVSVFTRYLAMPPNAAEAITLWVMGTHAFDAAEVFPRLMFTSPVQECGKTTALELVATMTHKGTLASNMTPAVMFRLIDAERPTLVLDEMDTYAKGNTDIVNLLNAGHKRSSAFVLRCEGDSHEPTAFSAWAPIAAAQIGEVRPPSLKSRAIEVRMHRAPRGEDRPRLRDADREHLRVLVQKAARCASDALESLKQADPEMPPEFEGRAADNWRLMLAIADVARGQWPSRAREAAIALSASDVELSRNEKVLAAIKRVLEANPHQDRFPSDELCRAIGKDDDDLHNLTQRGLARILKPFGIGPRVIRIGGETPRGYRRSDFKDAFARYLPRNPQHRNK